MLSGFDNTDTEKEEGEVQGGMVPGGGDGEVCRPPVIV